MGMGTGAPDVIARFYDLDVGHLDYDLPFYLEMARRCGSPILELGVGTGRVALPLARAGFAVTGVDASAAMLDALRAKAPPPRLELVRASFHEIRLRKRYRLAFFSFNSFMHLTGETEQQAALESVHRHLRTDGVLIVDLPAPSRDYAAAVGELMLEWVRTDPRTRHQVIKLVAAEGDAASQQEQVTYLFDEVSGDGRLTRQIAQFALHHFGRREIQHLLGGAGFEIEQTYGSHDLEPFGSKSERMILVARKRPGR